MRNLHNLFANILYSLFVTVLVFARASNGFSTYCGSCSLHNVISSSFTFRQPFHSSRIRCTQSRNFGLYITMAKGDGKKKRPKQNNVIPSSPPITPAPAPPPRVTNDINVPIRRQIRYAQLNKEAARMSGQSFRANNVKRTSYRKSYDEEEMEAAKTLRQTRAQEPEWDVILNATLSSPLVIIDGYNVIHKWPRLKKWMSKGIISKARQMLMMDLEELRSLKGWRIEVVFDGAGRNVQNNALGDGPGTTNQREKVSRGDMQESIKVTDHGIRVVYSGSGMSADSYIESRCLDAKSVTEGTLTSSFIVASDDQMIRVAAKNAGALAMSSQRIVDELKAVKKAALYRAEVAVAKMNGQTVRPEKLRDRGISTGGFGRRQVELVDKRKNTKKTKKVVNAALEDVQEGAKSTPYWAMSPNITKTSN